MMRLGVLSIIPLVLLAAPAAAQPADAMEAQRCIWRCLAASGGAAGKAYNRCIAAKCDGKSSRRRKKHRLALTRPDLNSSLVHFAA
jgi:hypothetical protein